MRELAHHLTTVLVAWIVLAVVFSEGTRRW